LRRATAAATTNGTGSDTREGFELGDDDDEEDDDIEGDDPWASLDAATKAVAEAHSNSSSSTAIAATDHDTQISTTPPSAPGKQGLWTRFSDHTKDSDDNDDESTMAEYTGGGSEDADADATAHALSDTNSALENRHANVFIGLEHSSTSADAAGNRL
jgi:hypothetical protein